LKWLEEVSRRYQLSIVTEVMSEFDVEPVSRVAKWLQIGARNMQNFSLLKRVGDVGRPVLLKRGPSATVDEWLASGEYLLASGAERVIFCERGVKGLAGPTRNTLDLATAIHMKNTLGQPVIVDPSHATGRRDLVVPLSKAAMAAGVDGVMVEVHPDAGIALSDGAQALDFQSLAELVGWLEASALK
jgi:3-deoxy-7-phosphoheptulonate synthase